MSCRFSRLPLWTLAGVLASCAPLKAWACAACGCTLSADAAAGYSAIPGLRFTPYNSFLTLKEIWTAGFLVLLSFWAARTAVEVRRQLWLVAAGMSLEVLFCVLEGLRRQERITGHVGQPNSLAAFLALAGATSLALFVTTPTLIRWLFLGTASGAAFACLHTASRGGLLALFASLLMISLFRNRWVFVLLVVLGLSYRLWLPEVILERIDHAYVVNRTGQIEAADTAEQRLAIWRAARKFDRRCHAGQSQ